jgi:hypothetical protein
MAMSAGEFDARAFEGELARIRDNLARLSAERADELKRIEQRLRARTEAPRPVLSPVTVEPDDVRPAI